jgi:hypothetical protein
LRAIKELKNLTARSRLYPHHRRRHNGASGTEKSDDAQPRRN